jgi:hypothetical protein
MARTGRIADRFAGPGSSQPINGDSVHRDRRVARTQMPGRARPNPVSGLRDQLAANRIHVQIVDHRKKRLWPNDIAVVAAAALPETIPHARPGADSKPWKPFRRLLAQKRDGLSRDRLLDSLQNEGDVVFAVAGPHDKWTCSGMKTYAQRSNCSSARATPIASASQRRVRSEFRN